MNKKRIIFLIASIIIISIIVLLLYKFNIIPHKQYTNRDFRQNNNKDNKFANRNRFNNDRNGQNNGPRNFDRNSQNNGNRNFDRNGQNNGNNPRFDKNRQVGFNNNNRFDKNRQGGNQRFGGNRPLDEKGIERNIKDIMAVETIENEFILGLRKNCRENDWKIS